MKNIVVLMFCMLLISGCSLFNRPNVPKVQNSRDQLNISRRELSVNNEEKMKQIAVLAKGTEFSLNTITNQSVEIKTALDLNSRIINISGNPHIDELEKIKNIVKYLNSEIDVERKRGVKLLGDKDQQILTLQNERKYIQNQYEEQIVEFEKQAIEMATKADKLQLIVNEVNSWFGLGGVFYGLKRFISTSLVFVLICIVLFFVLRFLASMHPIPATIFALFEYIGGYIITIIKGIVPKSINFSKHVEEPLFQRYKLTLNNVVEILEKMKIVQKKGNKVFTLNDAFDQLDRELSDPEKRLIDELTSDIKYD